MNVKIVTLISFVLFGCVSTVVDENKMEIARDLVEVAHSKSEKKLTVDALVPKMLDAVLEDNPNLTDSEIKQATLLVEQELESAIPDILEQMAQLYAQNFFKNELEELIVIFETRDMNDVWPPQQIRLLQKLNSTVPRINNQLGYYASSLGDQARDRLLAELEQHGDS